MRNMNINIMLNTTVMNPSPINVKNGTKLMNRAFRGNLVDYYSCGNVKPKKKSV